MHKRINITCNSICDMIWPSSSCALWSPSPKHRHDLHRHRRPTWISIAASWSSRQLLLLLPSLTHSIEVKQLHSVGTSYNNETTIRLLPVADNLQNMIISYNNVSSHHVLTISHHKHTLQKQVRRPLLCCCKFYVAATGLKNRFLLTQNHNVV